MMSDGSDNDSELEHQLSSTDVDEENMEEGVGGGYPGQKDDSTKGKKKLSKDTRTMALSASNSKVITIVSWIPG